MDELNKNTELEEPENTAEEETAELYDQVSEDELTQELQDEPEDCFLEETEEDSDAEEDGSSSQETEPEQPKKSMGKVIAVTVLSTLTVLALIAVMLYLVLTGSGKMEPISLFEAKSDSYTVSGKVNDAKINRVVATAGDAKLTNAELQMYYETNALNYQYQYGYYLMMMGVDLSGPLDSVVYDEATGQTWQEFFLDQSLLNWHIFAAMRQHADANGFTLDEKGQEFISGIDAKIQEMAEQSGCATPEQMVKEQISPFATVEGLRNYMIADYYYAAYIAHLEKQAMLADDQVEQYFNDHQAELAANGITKESGYLVDVRHVLIKPEGGTTDESGATTYSEEEWEACRVKAQALYDSWLAGEATEETFHQLAVDNSADGNASEGGIYTDVTQGYMVEPFDAWIFDESRQHGDSGLVKTDFGYHIMYFVDKEAKWIGDTVTYKIQKEVGDIVQQAMEQYPLEKKLKNVILSR